MLTLFFTGRGKNCSLYFLPLITQNQYELGSHHFLNFSSHLRGILIPNLGWTTQPVLRYLSKYGRILLASQFFFKSFISEICCIWIKAWHWHKICTRDMTASKNPSKTMTLVYEVIFDFLHFGNFEWSGGRKPEGYDIIYCNIALVAFISPKTKIELKKPNAHFLHSWLKVRDSLKRKIILLAEKSLVADFCGEIGTIICTFLMLHIIIVMGNNLIY